MKQKKDIIEIKNVSKRFFGEKEFSLKNFNLNVKEGEFLCIVGPSGCGKSTLARLIAGLDNPSKGQILYKGKKGKGVNPEISMVFQSFALFPWLTVRENVSFGARMSSGIDLAEEHWIKEYLKMVGLDKEYNSYPRDLSGGMRQRVGIARALVINPQVLILDEPFSQLDIITASELRKEILDIWQRQKLTIIMISHLIEEATELADRIVVMDIGIIKEIVENNLSRPREKEKKEFIKEEAIIEKDLGLSKE